MRHLGVLLFVLGFETVIGNICAAQSNTLDLRRIWPEIRKETTLLNRETGQNDEVAKARTIIAETPSKTIMAIPTNQQIASIGRLCAAILVLGEKGDISDLQKLASYTWLRIPNPSVIYDDLGYGHGGLSRLT